MLLNIVNSNLNLIIFVFLNSTYYFLYLYCCYPCFCNLVLPVFLGFLSVIGLFISWFLILNLFHFVDLTIFRCFPMICWITFWFELDLNFIFVCNIYWKTKFIWGRFREWNNKREHFRDQTTLKRKR